MRNELLDRLILNVLRSNPYPARSQDIAELLRNELGLMITSAKVGGRLRMLSRLNLVSAAVCKIKESPNRHFPEWGVRCNIWFIGARRENLARIMQARAYASLHNRAPVPTYSKLRPSTDDMRHMIECIAAAESL